MKYVASNTLDPNEVYELEGCYSPEDAAFMVLRNLGWSIVYEAEDEFEKKVMKSIDKSVSEMVDACKVWDSPMNGDEIQFAIDYFSDALKEAMGDKDNGMDTGPSEPEGD